MFVQLKSVAEPAPAPLTLYGCGNFEKPPEQLDLKDKVADVDTYRFSLETSELVTVERDGTRVPVLLVIADLANERCSFVCLSLYSELQWAEDGDWRGL